MPRVDPESQAEASSQGKVVQLRPEKTKQAAEMNLRVLSSPARWVLDQHGRGTLEKIAVRAGIEIELFEDLVHWISLEQFEEFLQGVRDLAGSEEKFIDACSYRMGDGYGPLRFVLLAFSPKSVNRIAARTMHLVCRVGTYEKVEQGPNGELILRYVSKKDRTRLACLCRQANGIVQPTLWGLPKARVVERKCLAQGDDCCEYEFQYFEKSRKTAALIGVVMGASVSLGLLAAGVGDM